MRNFDAAHAAGAIALLALLLLFAFSRGFRGVSVSIGG